MSSYQLLYFTAIFELYVWYLPQILTFMKVFHWLVQDRVDYMETTPATSRLAHLRIVSFMAVLLVRYAPLFQDSSPGGRESG